MKNATTPKRWELKRKRGGALRFRIRVAVCQDRGRMRRVSWKVSWCLWTVFRQYWKMNHNGLASFLWLVKARMSLFLNPKQWGKGKMDSRLRMSGMTLWGMDCYAFQSFPVCLARDSVRRELRRWWVSVWVVVSWVSRWLQRVMSSEYIAKNSTWPVCIIPCSF